MAKLGLPKGSGKRLKVREKSVKSQGILKWILSGNPEFVFINLYVYLKTGLSWLTGAYRMKTSSNTFPEVNIFYTSAISPSGELKMT